MNEALTIVGAFFTAGIGTFLVTLLLAWLFRAKGYGIDEGHVVLAIVVGIMGALAVGGFVAGSLWF